VTRVPIACTLTIEDAQDRVGEWRTFFITHTDQVAVRDPTRAAVRLKPGDAALLAAADLAAREQACCSFFEFSIRINPHGRWLEVNVPEGAVLTLTDFISLAGPQDA
jgi:hypothetical protein